MGTGGGEFLLQLGHHNELTSITEGYLPNYELCKEKLEPLGITVKFIADDHTIPYENESFDIVINRHEAYDISEVNRILKQKGIFITQQVGNENNRMLSESLLGKRKDKFPNCYLNIALKECKKEALTILESDEKYSETKFFDIGAVVFYAKTIEWEFENFSVTRCMDRLMFLQKQLEENGHINSIEHRYYFVAQKQ